MLVHWRVTVFPDSLPRFHGSCQFCIRLLSTLSPFRKFFRKDLNAFQSCYIDGEWTFRMITHRIKFKRELSHPWKTNNTHWKKWFAWKMKLVQFPFETTTTQPTPLSGGGTTYSFTIESLRGVFRSSGFDLRRIVCHRHSDDTSHWPRFWNWGENKTGVGQMGGRFLKGNVGSCKKHI